MDNTVALELSFAVAMNSASLKNEVSKTKRSSACQLNRGNQFLQHTNRIAILCASLGGGGAERAMLNLACGLAEQGEAVDLVLVRAEGPFLGDVPPQVRIVDLRAQRAMAAIPALVRYLRTERPVVLLSALDHVNVVAIWAKYLSRVSARVVVSVHAPLSQGIVGCQTRLFEKILLKLIKLSYPRANAVVSVSQGVRHDLIDFIGLQAHKVCAIYNPIINSKLYDLGQEDISHSWLKPQQPPVILAVGRLSVEKDYPTLIRALQRVRQQRPARLLILGEGEERPKLEYLVRALKLEKDVKLLGFVANPYAFMRQASCLVLSSTYEGFGNVLVEALAMGCPVVSTDCPAGPTEILNGGEWGRMVPVGDHKAMAQAILDTLNDGKGAQSLILNAYLKRFEVDQVVSSYRNVFHG